MGDRNKKRLKRGKQLHSKLKQLRSFNVVAVFIAKNEEQALPRLIKSLDGFADRVVIVDTGSTDNTIEVAKQLGAEVHSIAWPDSFSDARNKAVELANPAKATWIAMFDADEVLDKGRELRWKLQKISPHVGVISIYHRTKFGHKFPRNCIWRPGKAKWKYRFHEHLIPNEKGIQVIVPHFVDHPDDVGKNHDNDRIMELMRMDTVEYPEEQTRKYYYGRQLFYRKEPNCLEILKEVYEKSPWSAEAAQAAVFAGNYFEWKADKIKESDETNKESLAVEALDIACSFYKMSVAKYPKLRGSYAGLIRTSRDIYERLVAAVTAMKIQESTFFDDPPRLYSQEGASKFIETIEKYKHLVKVEGEPVASNAEAIS